MTVDTLFAGRMSRRNFLFAQTLLIILVLGVLAYILGGDFTLQSLLAKNKELVKALLFLAPVGLGFQFICSFRRLHDINQSGLWALLLLGSLLFIPLLDIALLVYLSYKKDDAGANTYGVPDTRPLLKSILNLNNKA